VGDGSEINFWRDVWYAEQLLKEAFLEFSIGCLRGAFVADHLQFINVSLQCNVNFVRARFGVRKRCRIPLEWVCGNILGGVGEVL
jgi:hypothetical protein